MTDQKLISILVGVFLLSDFAIPPIESIDSETAMSENLIPRILQDAEILLATQFGCEIAERLYTIDDTFGDVLRFNCNNVMDISTVVVWSRDGSHFEFATYPPELQLR